MMSREAADALIHAHALKSIGAPLSRAKAVIVALHGRGADAASILGLGDAMAQPDVAFLAPEATGRAWYPQSFVAPVAANEPYLSRALAQVSAVLDALAAAGVPAAKTGLMGFSQGACLALETAIRRPRGYGVVLGFSGGYIGPMVTELREAAGSLSGATVFLGCSDIDSHIPLKRVHETAALMKKMRASVTARIYPGFGHAINADEVAEARRLLAAMQGSADGG
jgi:phospholipase/carboxylesterase